MICLETGQTLRGVASAATRVSYAIEGVEIDGAGVETYKTLAQGQLPSSAGTLYTAPTGKIALVKSIHLINTGAACTAQLFAGGTAATNAITGTVSLGVNVTGVYEEGGWRFTQGAGYELERSV